MAHTRIVLDDHFASDTINEGVAARAGFVESFGDQAQNELEELRALFLRKAVLAGQDLVARPLRSVGHTLEQLAGMTLGDTPPAPELDRLRDRRGRPLTAPCPTPGGRRPGRARCPGGVAAVAAGCSLWTSAW